MGNRAAAGRLILVGMLAGLMLLGGQVRPGRADEPDEDRLPIDRLIGEAVADFTLDDARTGEPFRLYSLKGKKAVVLYFMANDCPISNKYLPRLAELSKDYESQGVAFLGINSNRSEMAEKVAAHAREMNVPFPVLKDPQNKVADTLMVMHTCETLLLDGRATLRYRGAVDDQHGLGASKPEPGGRYLVDAIEAVLDGKAPETTSTSVVGCAIERNQTDSVAKPTYPRIRAASDEILEAYEEVQGPAPEVGDVTYTADVAPILQEKCQRCHRPGQPGPFSLLSYNDAKRWAGTIYEVVETRRMPPWHADPRHGHFANDRSLSAREREVLMAWVEQNVPEGDPADLPPPKTYADGWTIGQPDIVFEMPQDEYVAAQGTIPYRHFRVPTNFKEDVWIQAAEARPGDRSVVHHIIVYVDDHSGGRRREEGSHLCGYAPGDMPSVYPPGIAKKIPAGSDLVFEVHYTPVGKIRVDRSSVGMIFATTPPTREAITHPIANGDIEIPPRDPDHAEFARMTVKNAPIILLSFMPHMHLRGKSFEYRVKYPGEDTEKVLLSVPAYDFNWQSYYTLAEPLTLPVGTEITCEAHYDNSAGNPSNPNPDETIHWGQQTWEEMMIGYVDIVIDRPLPEVKPEAPKAEEAAAARSDRPRPPLRRVLRVLRRAGRD